MAVTYVEVLKAKKASVLKELEELRARAAEIAALVNLREGQLKNLDELLGMEAGGGPHAASPDVQAAQARTLRLSDQAYEVLRDKGEPLHYRELARLMTTHGVYIPGQDPAANLIAHLSRDQRFARTEGRGVYGLLEWPSVKVSSRGRSRRAKSRPTASQGR